ncbi:unnamed protein product, partial [Brachionus calyciflorus]
MEHEDKLTDIVQVKKTAQNRLRNLSNMNQQANKSSNTKRSFLNFMVGNTDHNGNKNTRNLKLQSRRMSDFCYLPTK